MQQLQGTSLKLQGYHQESTSSFCYLLSLINLLASATTAIKYCMILLLYAFRSDSWSARRRHVVYDIILAEGSQLTPSLPATFSLLKVITNDSASSAGTWPTTRPSSRTENQLCDVIESRLSSSCGIIPKLHSSRFSGFVSTILFTTCKQTCMPTMIL